MICSWENNALLRDKLSLLTLWDRASSVYRSYCKQMHFKRNHGDIVSQDLPSLLSLLRPFLKLCWVFSPPASCLQLSLDSPHALIPLSSSWILKNWLLPWKCGGNIKYTPNLKSEFSIRQKDKWKHLRSTFHIDHTLQYLFGILWGKRYFTCFLIFYF